MKPSKEEILVSNAPSTDVALEISEFRLVTIEESAAVLADSSVEILFVKLVSADV